jgi:hypothetical protein
MFMEYYVLDLEARCPQLRSPQPDDQTISLTMEDSQATLPTIIKHTLPSTAIRILGIHLCPNGDFSTHIQHMKQKADSYAKCLATSRITAAEMVTFLQTIYAPSMSYSLPALAVKETQLTSVQTKMMATALNKMGASRTTPTAIRHGPLELGGLNLMDLRTEVGISNIRFLRNAVYTDSEAGRLILLSLKFTQLESGLSEDLMASPCLPIPYVTKTWLMSVRRFAATHSIRIHLTNTLRIRFNGHQDACIMNPTLLSTLHRPTANGHQLGSAISTGSHTF